MTRILVIDDEAGLREFLEDSLATQGWRVDTAEDGRSGIDALSKTAYDVVLTDLRMPGPDGTEVLRFCLHEQPTTQVILLTAHGTVETAVEAMKLGAFDYLQKPISGPEELRLLVRRAAERKRLLAQRETSHRTTDPLPPLSYGDPAMASVSQQLDKVSPTEATVLLTGESGTGKEVAARHIHNLSPRSQGPFLAINCAAITDNLLESELFGHEKGAFTGAIKARAGRLELAAGGTLFLDEIGELRLKLQAKLLRVLQERTFERVGGSRTHDADVRWIAATNRDLEQRVAQGQFREDLFYRLAVFPVQLPPLRDRSSDVVPLAERLLLRIGANLGVKNLRLTAEAATSLEQASWPGNVREMSNVLERAAILSVDGEIDAHLLLLRDQATQEGQAPGLVSLVDVEKDAIERALGAERGNRQRAAERLGIGLRTLYDKLKRYQLS